MARKKAGASLAYIYAEALYDAAVDAGVLPEVQEELLAFRDMLERYPRLALFLDSPTISLEKKQQVLGGLTQATHTLTQPGLNFLRVLVRRQRVELMDLIIDAFHDHCNKKAGIAEVEVQSADALADDETERIRTVLGKVLERKVVLRTEVKPELLGGVVLTHRDRVFDASIRHQLTRMLEEIRAARSGLHYYTD